MKTKITFLLFLPVALQSENWPPNPTQYPELAKLIAGYACSAQISQEVDQQIKRQEKTYTPDQFDTAQISNQFFIKPGIYRLINARRMQNVITENNLNRLKVPQKCLHFNGSLHSVAPRIKDTSYHQEISQKDVDQLAKLAELTGFYDWKGGKPWGKNIHQDPQGNFIFIDTGNESFCINPMKCLRELRYWLDKKYNLHPKIQEYFSDQTRKLLSPKNISVVTPLHKNSTYDDADIDFELAKKEAKIWQTNLDQHITQEIKTFIAANSTQRKNIEELGAELIVKMKTNAKMHSTTNQNIHG